MKEQICYGKFKYISFILIDIVFLFLANYLVSIIYHSHTPFNYGYYEHLPVIIIMIVIDIVVTFGFNTLCRVLRRKAQREIKEGLRHVGLSFVILTVVLFTFRQGTSYSRIVISLSYLLYLMLFVTSHEIWKKVLTTSMKGHSSGTAILMTTDRFIEEGLDELEKLNIDVKSIYLLKNLKTETFKNIPVAKTWEEAAATICWNMIEKVYIYGLDHQMVPEYLVKACHDMGLLFNLVDFNYRLIDVKTIKNDDPKYGSLSFLEGKRDIPFPIRRVYWITETEANLHRGFHAHKLNCQLLYCPYGEIDILLDDGQKKTTITLDKPGKGLLLMPGLWREMIWRKSGSVLCVLASEYYYAKEYIRNYDEFIEYNQKYRDSADPLKKMSLERKD